MAISRFVAGASLVGCSVVACSAGAGIVTIDFDFDTKGDPIIAPGGFSKTTALRDLYAPWGVHFSAPTGQRDGGGILNQIGNFGVPAHSGENFLAFNNQATYSDGGTAQGPQRVDFDAPVSFVSLWAAGGFDTEDFFMAAFDSDDVFLGEVAVSTQDYAELRIDADNISWILFAGKNGDGAWVVDDLSFQTVPAPGAIALLAAAGLLTRRASSRRRS